jgi:hypothetical protein
MSTWSPIAIKIEIKQYGMLCFLQFCERYGVRLVLRLRVQTGFGMKWQRNVVPMEAVDELGISLLIPVSRAGHAFFNPLPGRGSRDGPSGSPCE